MAGKTRKHLIIGIEKKMDWLLDRADINVSLCAENDKKWVLNSVLIVE